MLRFLPTRAPANDAERIAWLRLTRTENIGPITFHKLLARFGSTTQALDALPDIAARRGKRNYKAYLIASAEKNSRPRIN